MCKGSSAQAPCFKLAFADVVRPFARVRLVPMLHPKSTVILGLLVLLTGAETAAQSQHGAWVDVIPMTRRLFGANDASDIAIAVGWSSSTTSDGWRALVGLDLGAETQENFGTTITNRTRRTHIRVGRRWRMGEPDPDRTCWLNLGLDGLHSTDHIGSESSNIDFTSNNETTETMAGISGVMGVQCRLGQGFHLVTEARLDAVYTHEKVRVFDSFGGNFSQDNKGWNTDLNPPLQLMLVLDL